MTQYRVITAISEPARDPVSATLNADCHCPSPTWSSRRLLLMFPAGRGDSIRLVHGGWTTVTGVCGQLLEAAAAAGEIRPGLDPYELLLGVGSLCAGAGGDPRYNPRHLVELVIAGLRIW